MSPKKKPVAEWSAAQVASQLSKHQSVSSATVTSFGRVAIERTNLSSLLVATTAVEHVSKSIVEHLLSAPKPDFIVNIPKESFVDGEALDLLESEDVPIGHESELYNILHLDDVSDFKNKHLGWIEQALSQDKNVEKVERLYDRVFLVKRKSLVRQKIAFLWEYELTAEKLRTAKRWFKEFDLVVISNPIGTATGDAEIAARSIGCRIVSWDGMFNEFEFFSKFRQFSSEMAPQQPKEFAELKISEKASLLEPFIKGLEWYLFGSILTSKDVAEDIDVLVVYPDGTDAESVRKLLSDFLLSAPIDLMLMSQSEEMQTDFIRSQACKRIHPQL